MPASSASFNSSLFKELIIFIINSSLKTQSLLMLFHPRSQTVPETSLLRSVPACPVPPCLGSSLPLWTTPESSWPARPPLPVKCSPSAPRLSPTLSPTRQATWPSVISSSPWLASRTGFSYCRHDIFEELQTFPTFEECFVFVVLQTSLL